MALRLLFADEPCKVSTRTVGLHNSIPQDEVEGWQSPDVSQRKEENRHAWLTPELSRSY